MGTVKKAAMWVLTVFMALVCLAFFPSVTSLLAIAFIAVALPIEKIQDFWFLHNVNGGKKVLILVGLFLVLLMSTPSSNADKDVENDSQSRQNTTEEQEVKDEEPGQEDEGTLIINPSDETEFDTSNYLKIDSEILFEYGGYLGGQDIVTVITVAEKEADLLKAKTENNDGFFFSVVCNFEDGVPDGIKDGDILTIAGTVEEKSEIAESISFLDSPTASIVNCSIIGHGEIAQELKDGVPSQREIGEQAKQAYESEVAAGKKEERDEYISLCQTVSYSDVERNPDNYEGTKIKFSGEVVQVAEGWFDSVTLRVDSGGNMWYVTYSREEGESRILEGDNITCYGECDGVKSYTTVLGSQVTIPSLKMEYYD